MVSTTLCNFVFCVDSCSESSPEFSCEKRGISGSGDQVGPVETFRASACGTRARLHGKLLSRRVVQCYADWNQCDNWVLAAAQGGGCNVLVWAFINFCRAMPRAPVQVTGGPDISCFRRVTVQLERSGYNVVHFASVGGWNQPHPEGIAAPEAFSGVRRLKQ